MDFSSVAIEKQKVFHRLIPGNVLEWHIQDVRKLDQSFKPASFLAAIDKECLDGMISIRSTSPSEEIEACIGQYMQQARQYFESRVVKADIADDPFRFTLF